MVPSVYKKLKQKGKSEHATDSKINIQLPWFYIINDYTIGLLLSVLATTIVNSTILTRKILI